MICGSRPDRHQLKRVEFELGHMTITPLPRFPLWRGGASRFTGKMGMPHAACRIVDYDEAQESYDGILDVRVVQ